VTVAIASVGAGLGLVWLMVRPEMASALATGLLLATMALLFLPVVAYAAWEWDHRQAVERSRASHPPTVEHRSGGRQVGGGIRHAKAEGTRGVSARV